MYVHTTGDWTWKISLHSKIRICGHLCSPSQKNDELHFIEICPFYEEIRMRRPTNIPKTIIIKLKAWIYQHEILPRLMWLLLINEVATTTVEAMARKVGGYLKRWLGFQLSSCTTIIYINWIRVSSVAAECRLAMTSNDSAHNSIFRPGIQTRTGRRWSAKTSVDKPESLIYLLDIIRNTIIGEKTWEGRIPSIGKKHHRWGDALWTTRNPRGCV